METPQKYHQNGIKRLSMPFPCCFSKSFGVPNRMEGDYNDTKYHDRKGDAAKRHIYMELIVISENKLKVMLTADDMRHYNLDCDTIDSGNAPARRAFRSILEDARAQTGFDTGKEKIFVQLYPGKSGGCEMFVTKLGATKAEEEKLSPLRKEPTPTEYAYVFPALSHLLLASRRLKEQGGGSARAFVDRDRREFFLVLSEDVPALAEYEGRKCKSREIPYILEYCRCFCRDAAAVLAEFV